MTNILKPHDFYLTLMNYSAKKNSENITSEEHVYIDTMLTCWEKIRFGETASKSFLHLRLMANTISNVDAHTVPLLALIDNHVDKCCDGVEDSYARAIKGSIGIIDNSTKGE